jgi:L-alanine-DL-glutamate epimerase-like enolase superfamily enzyme
MIAVILTTDEGLTGLGYTATIGIGGRAILAFLSDPELKKIVVGHNPFDYERIWYDLYWQTMFVGRQGISRMAIAAIDVALWDLMSQAAGQPLFRLLGGFRDTVEAYGSGGYLHLTEQQLVDEMKQFVREGFKAVKMKVGLPDSRQDLHRVNAVRQAIGKDIRIMVDANQGWDVSTSIKMGREFEKYDVFWLEEPVPAGDFEGHAQIAEALDLHLATGETLYSREDFRRLFYNRAVDIVQADVSRVGGITEWRKIAAIAEDWNVPMAPHFVLDIHCHLVAAVPHAIYVEYIFPWMRSVFVDPLPIRDGRIRLSEKPGLGLELKPELVEQYRLSE